MQTTIAGQVQWGWLGASVARTVAAVGWERLAVPRVRGVSSVPPRIESITPAWLTGALCAGVPGAEVVGLELGDRSSGTSVRRQLRLTYNAAGNAAGLPHSVFVKSTPSVLTRIANGITGTSVTEAGFYNELRPFVDLEAPVGFHSASSSRSYRSVHLLEDLTATRGATFCTPLTPIGRAQAEEIVVQLATLHSAPGLKPYARRPPSWLRTYRQWWAAAFRVADIRKYHEKGLIAAADVLPSELRGRSTELWAAFERSIDAHEAASSVIHNDVHLGNWYVTGDGHMGLCDWQCVAVGSGARDLAYALVTALAPEHRRAWERELVDLYVERVTATPTPVDRAEMWDRYRAQVVGALLMWTPTLSRPPVLPDMQPREVALEMLRRIGAAISDVDVM